MQKNLILAVVLSSLVYIGWYSYIEKDLPRQDRAAPTAAGDLGAAAREQKSAGPSAGTPAGAAPAQALMRSARAEAARTGSKLTTAVAKALVRITAGKADYTFLAPGAALASLVYQDLVAPVELIPDAGSGFFATTFQSEFALNSRTGDSVEFAADLPGGLKLYKKFELSPDNGLNSLTITAVNSSAATQTLPAWELLLGPGLGTVKSEEKENPGLWKAQYTYNETGRKHPTIKELKDDPAQHDCVWAGLDNRYFLAALAGGDLGKTRPYRREETIKDKKAPLLAVPFGASELKPGEKREWAMNFYFGPKDYQFLQKLGMGLDRSVDFGFFAPLAKITNSALTYFYGLTGNYGVAIIFISVLIQLMLTPLSFKSYKSMAIMKKLQPEMQSIQKRYKEDPKRMNQEVMDLYKRHGTNPLGGCLPMLFQIPVFFALFTALRNSWTLHGAPFIFWIKDLSAKDPYYVLPLVMGGIMFLQQYLTPQTSDPSQAKMMKWMPVIFTFMFLSFPAGLVMYWLINSIWGFAQSMYLQKKLA